MTWNLYEAIERQETAARLAKLESIVHGVRTRHEALNYEIDDLREKMTVKKRMDFRKWRIPGIWMLRVDHEFITISWNKRVWVYKR